MRFTAILSVAAFAGFTVAQSQEGPGKGCAGQNVLLTCLGTQAARIATCGPLDYVCQCQYQADVLQCYDQCPKDINRSSEENKLVAYCVAASATASIATPTASTFTIVSATASGSKEPTPTESASETEETDSPSGTKSASGSATSTGTAKSAAAKITWMCASSLLAVLTAAFMVL